MSAAKRSRPKTRKDARRRSAARLAAVQALYEMEMSGAPVDPVLREFLQERWRAAGDAEDGPLVEPDNELLTHLVRGAAGRRADLDGMIDPALSEGWPPERLEAVVRAILRVGTFEIMSRPDIPPRVAIAEYVEVAKAFFEGGEATLVNGVLDRLARVLREGEMEQRGGG